MRLILLALSLSACLTQGHDIVMKEYIIAERKYSREDLEQRFKQAEYFCKTDPSVHRVYVTYNLGVLCYDGTIVRRGMINWQSDGEESADE